MFNINEEKDITLIVKQICSVNDNWRLLILFDMYLLIAFKEKRHRGIEYSV